MNRHSIGVWVEPSRVETKKSILFDIRLVASRDLDCVMVFVRVFHPFVICFQILLSISH